MSPFKRNRHTQMNTSKTGNLSNTGGLYQCQYPACDTEQFYKMLPLGTLGKVYKSSLSVISFNCTVQIQLSQLKISIKKRLAEYRLKCLLLIL